MSAGFGVSAWATQPGASVRLASAQASGVDVCTLQMRSRGASRSSARSRVSSQAAPSNARSTNIWSSASLQRNRPRWRGVGRRMRPAVSIPGRPDLDRVGVPAIQVAPCEHMGQLVAHRLGTDPAQLTLQQRVDQRLGGRIAKHQPVEHDVGVDDRSWHPLFCFIHRPIVWQRSRVLAGSKQPAYNQWLFATETACWHRSATAQRRLH